MSGGIPVKSKVIASARKRGGKRPSKRSDRHNAPLLAMTADRIFFKRSLPAPFTRIISMIDRLITMLMFVLLIFMSSGVPLMSGEVSPLEQARIGTDNGQSLAVRADNETSQAISGTHESIAAERDNENSSAPAPSLISGAENPAPDDLAETDRKQADYDEAENYCAAFPERPAGDSNVLCSYLSDAIKYSETCVGLYQNWETTWRPEKGSEKRKAAKWLTRTQNLKVEYGLKCSGDKE
ncbi:MAG: hypothetical protein LBP58_04490 [Azoarcus sp.]|jgi:hypothetical protein|nr:hypothetical protein [Azoarcus sp.]